MVCCAMHLTCFMGLCTTCKGGREACDACHIQPRLMVCLNNPITVLGLEIGFLLLWNMKSDPVHVSWISSRLFLENNKFIKLVNFCSPLYKIRADPFYNRSCRFGNCHLDCTRLSDMEEKCTPEILNILRSKGK